jgi:predicted KAP-like P-loop ATPase
MLNMGIEFNFSEYSLVLSSLVIENLRNREKPIVIGIHGEWGSGKTTLLDDIARRVVESNVIKKRETFIIPIKFNAWRFEKERHLIIPLLKTLYYELEKESQKEEDKSVGNTLNLIKKGLFSIISGVEIELELGFVQAKYSGKESIAYFEESENTEQKKGLESFSKKYESIYFDILSKITELTKQNNIRFLFLIDDLDRCLPENSVKMLEAIKLFLDIENCAFVMAIDKEVVELGVEYNYRDYKQISDKVPITGNEYLEKMITLPFLLPSIQKEKIKEFIEKNKKYTNLFENENELLELFYDTVPSIPRKVIRALDLYNFKLRLNRALKNEIDKKIILVVSLIELFIPELYRHVKKEFERDRDSDSETFIQLINTRNSAKSDGKSILDIEIEEQELTNILKRFSNSRNKFGINNLLDYILDYDTFHKDLRSYYIFNKES